MGAKRLEGVTPSLQGGMIFGFVAYETIALAVNFVARRRVIPPITDIIGPWTHKPWIKMLTWLFLGFWWDHFYNRGCSPDCRNRESESWLGRLRYPRNQAGGTDASS